MNIQSLSERERSLIKQHAAKELEWALRLIDAPETADNWRDVAASLRKVAYRYETLAEDTP